jgi:hypothetical protein
MRCASYLGPHRGFRLGGVLKSIPCMVCICSWYQSLDGEGIGNLASS